MDLMFVVDLFKCYLTPSLWVIKALQLFLKTGESEEKKGIDGYTVAVFCY